MFRISLLSVSPKIQIFKVLSKGDLYIFGNNTIRMAQIRISSLLIILLFSVEIQASPAGELQQVVNYHYHIDNKKILPFECYWFEEGIYIMKYWKDFEAFAIHVIHQQIEENRDLEAGKGLPACWKKDCFCSLLFFFKNQSTHNQVLGRYIADHDPETSHGDLRGKLINGYHAIRCHEKQ